MREIIDIIISRREFFWDLALEHIGISILSILIAGAVGLLIGIGISEYRRSSPVVLGIINFIYTIPSISLLGFLIPFSGIGNTTAVLALTVYALLPMVRNTYTGITGIDPAVIEAARGMGSTDMQILVRIKLPLALPVIIAGLRSMVTMTIALAGIASFIGAGGLGVAIYRGITTNNAAMTMAGSLLIAVLALLFDFLLALAARLTTARNSSLGKRLAVIIPAAAALICVAGVLIGTMGRKDIIKVATKPMTEQYIMGEMLKELIEKDTGLAVELVQGVGGGTANIQPGLEAGEFDLYPEYTGTGWNMVLKQEGLYDESMFAQLQQEYGEELNLQWIGMYGFNNTFGLAVRTEAAEKYNLKTYSDLAAVSDQLIFGAEYDFYEREDGYDALCEAYGYNFKNTVDLDIGLKYQAIEEGKIDVMNIFTTDGQLTAADITVLLDDQQFYPSYLCGNVIRQETLAEYPELEAVLNQLDGILDDGTMAELNYQVETNGKEPQEVAHQFLTEQGLAATAGGAK